MAQWSGISKGGDFFLDDKDTNGLESFVFSRALQSRDKKHIEEYGEEYRATNIPTSIDQMAKQYPNVRRWYDELSEVCHLKSAPGALALCRHRR